MNWSLRIREWRHVLRLERKRMTWRSWLAMLRAVWSGFVPKDVFLTRIRTCLRCPIYDAENKRCRCPKPGFEHLGCGCFCPWSAMTRAPYPKGCWGREVMKDLGWPAYK